ncbi:DinB family protein [Oceanobacillus chungangensis]|uniref:DinB family protein n=1 Tax=Oceanobacillus chungangensis TaxID=1229152 RepID=A0A3D8Q2Z6_9BACI|nr:DinB family protein [Oceanobacillus chungangensis]RDW22121.1 DinB family protein [Oceanobacillus chungangensis]
MCKILKEFSETLDAIQKLIDIQESQLSEPISKDKWSIREIVGHLYYWDKYNLEKMVPRMTNGANLPQFPNHDEHNKEAIAYLRDYSVESIIETFIETRKELIESIYKVGEDVRFTIGSGKRQFSGESFIKIFVKHDIHHLKQINKKLNN